MGVAVRLGLQLFASRRDGESTVDALDRVISQVVEAEKYGFSTVWLAEHHATDWNVITDPLTVLAYVSAATSRIRLGTAVVNLGLHHPVAVAERAALVNALSGGRRDLGIGKGFARADYARFSHATDDVPATFAHHHDDLVAQLHRETVPCEIPIWLSTTGRASTLRLAREHRARPAARLSERQATYHRRIGPQLARPAPPRADQSRAHR